jgi:pyruvate kinase
LPGINLSTRSMTHKDWDDLEWGITHDVDFVALSFVRHPDDLVAVRDRLDEAGSRTRLIAKIERPEAIEHIEAILALADGLMVARGDLGLETELSQVPILQKRLIERCRQANKPVITATQMLESMVNASTPTRAEISDVANAIYDGTDAIMLSAETATGQYPEEAVNVLHKVAIVTEADLAQSSPDYRRVSTTSAATAIAEGAAITARSLGARRVVVYSQTGVTARLMAHYRLPMPVVAVTNVLTTYRQLSLSFGIHPVYMPDIVSMSQLLEEMDHLVLARHWGEIGDTLVLVSSLDGRDGNTDTLHVHHVRS